MISSLRLKNFKNFEDATFQFGPFSVIAGENATGKSNLGDALRILQGIATQFDLDSIFKGVEHPIRTGEDTATVCAEIALPNDRIAQYQIGFCATGSDQGAFRVVHEELRGDGEVILTRSPSTEAQGIAPSETMEAPVHVLRKSGNLEPMDNRSVSLTALFGSSLAPEVPELARAYILSLQEILRRIRCLAFAMPDLRAPGARGAKSIQHGATARGARHHCRRAVAAAHELHARRDRAPIVRLC